MRHTALLALVAVGCGTKLVDPCAGVAGTCLAVQVDPSSTVSAIDSASLHLVGDLFDATKSVGNGRTLSLPIAVGVVFDSLPSSPLPLQVTVNGSRAGTPVGEGSAAVTVTAGLHQAVHVALDAPGASDLGVATDLPVAGEAADLATSDGGGCANCDDGGNLALMKFAVFGDTRPSNADDTSSYPSAVISSIFQLAQTRGAQFVIVTGDYMFATTAASAQQQVNLFRTAASGYTLGRIYPAMGNLECTGQTSSNCPNLDESPNVQAFMQMLGGFAPGVTQPYYRIDVATPFGKAKLLFIAANAWSTTQQSWLQTQLADPTTYSFVVRHEPPSDTQAPGTQPSETLVMGAHFTLEFDGHLHEYTRIDTQHVISGNAGAPLMTGSYGLLMVEQLANGNINVSNIDEASGSVTDTWTVSPSGGPM